MEKMYFGFLIIIKQKLTEPEVEFWNAVFSQSEFQKEAKKALITTALKM